MRLELSTFRAAATAGTSNTLLAQLRVGAVVEAIAVRDLSDGQLWLKIGATQVPARIASGDAAGPSNGERLQLRVLRDHPVLALESIEVNDTEATAVNDGLRRFLPRQSSPAPLLSNLAWLATQGGEPQLNRAVKDAAQRLWQALPDANELATPEGLANAAKRSGAFLEANLAQSDALEARDVLTRDVKALLINLKQILVRSGASGYTSEQLAPGPLPTLRGPVTPLASAPATLSVIDAPAKQLNELAAQTDGALARVNTVQLVNSEAAGAASAWLLELPIRRDNHAETVRFRFERNSAPENATEQSWTVEAALNLGVSGALHARVSLYGKRVGVQLRAEPPSLVNELTAQAPALSAILRDAGLDVDRVICLHGMPADDRELRAASLLDVRA